MLLTMHIESVGNIKRHLDEVTGEIDFDQGNIEILKPLALKLRTGLLNCDFLFLVTFFCVQVHTMLLKKGIFSVHPLIKITQECLESM